MKIRISSPKRRPFSLHLPLSFASVILSKNSKKQVTPQQKAAAKLFLRQLKNYVKQHGHFTLLQVYSADGSTVEIVV